MHGCNDLPELPASTLHVTEAEARAHRWELDAALAVLARAHEEWAQLGQAQDNGSEREVVRRRLQSAQRLVERIHGKMAANGLPSGRELE